MRLVHLYIFDQNTYKIVLFYSGNLNNPQVWYSDLNLSVVFGHVHKSIPEINVAVDPGFLE